MQCIGEGIFCPALPNSMQPRIVPSATSTDGAHIPVNKSIGMGKHFGSFAFDTKSLFWQQISLSVLHVLCIFTLTTLGTATMTPDTSPSAHSYSLMTTLPDKAIRRRLLRDDITQALLRVSEEDLNDRRSRFVPRNFLIRVLNFHCVLRLLEILPGPYNADTLQEMARRISPHSGQCCCHDKQCTGGRMILATLLLIGKEDLITSLFSPPNPSVCDRSLPIRLSPAEEAEDEGMAGGALLATLLTGLNAKETELFFCSQWQVYTPYLTTLTSDSIVKTFPRQMTLPWVELERIGSSVHGDGSYVERIKIHPDNHILVS